MSTVTTFTSAVRAPVCSPIPTAGRAAAPEDDYEVFCDCVRDLTGLDLSQYKRPQMERRLRSFYAPRGITCLADACPQIREDPDELAAVLDRITINVSQLWRNPEQWALIEDEILPDLFGQRATSSVRAWSAGCSYGAEAYTLASVAHHRYPTGAIKIEGTDIDRRMVARARLGIFSVADARSAPIDALERDFERTEKGWKASAVLRSLTHFETGDLLRSRIMPSSFDLVLCRNTVIYFSEPVRDQVHARLTLALRTGGYLVIGSTERVTDARALGLKAIHPFIYQKI